MAPWLMLLAQMYSKKKEEEQARKDEVTKLQTRRAQQLGGNTMGIEAAQFNRSMNEKSYASPEELFAIYNQLGSGKKDQGLSNAQDAAGNLEPNQSAYTLQNPDRTQLELDGNLRTPEQLQWQQPQQMTPPSDYQLPTPGMLEQDDDSPFYSRRIRL